MMPGEASEPSEAYSPVPQAGTVWGFALACLISISLSFVVLWPNLGSGLKPDSFGYWLIAKSFFTNKPYHVDAVRDFYLPPELPVPSRSFPPLFPMMIAAWHGVFQSGFSSGVYLNLLGLIGLILVAALFARHLTGKLVGLSSFGVFLFILIDPHFREELIAGTPYPWHYLLLITSIWTGSAVVLNPRRRNLVCFGAILGLLILLRFDQTLYAAVALGLVYLLTWRKSRSWKTATLALSQAGVVTLLVISPWLVRNQVVFGTPLAADNAITAKSTETVTVILCAYVGNRPPQYSDNPKLWWRTKFSHLRNNLGAWFRFYPLTGLCLAVSGFVLINRWYGISESVKIGIAMALLYITVALLGLSLTPFDHERYYSPYVFLYLFFTLILLDRESPFILQFNRWSGWFMVLTLSFITLCVALPQYESLSKSKAFRWRILPRDENPRRQFFNDIATKTGLSGERQPKRIVAVQYDSVARLDAEAFTSMTDIPSIMLPFNVGSDTPAFRYWLNYWKPDYLLVFEDWVGWLGFPQHVVARYPLANTARTLVLVDTAALLEK
jgi:hypothetical protein